MKTWLFVLIIFLSVLLWGSSFVWIWLLWVSGSPPYINSLLAVLADGQGGCKSDYETGAGLFAASWGIVTLCTVGAVVGSYFAYRSWRKGGGDRSALPQRGADVTPGSTGEGGGGGADGSRGPRCSEKCRCVCCTVLLVSLVIVLTGISACVGTFVIAMLSPCALSVDIHGQLHIPDSDPIMWDFCKADEYLECEGASELSVIVIGAGISGAAAARDLSAAGVAVTVLEARNRTGGRVSTETETGVDLGASFVHGPHCNPLTDLVECSGAPSFESGGNGKDVWIPSYISLSSNTQDALGEVCGSVQEEALISNSGSRDIKKEIGTAATEAMNSLGFDDAKKSECGLAIKAGIAVDSTGWSNHSVEGFRPGCWGWRPFDFQYGYLDDESYPDLEVVGYAKVVDYLLEEAKKGKGGVDILLGKEVNEVASLSATGSGEVRVGTTDGTGYSASAVLVTVPLGVLKKGSIAFSPPLPGQIQTAINGLAMGTLNKVWLFFSSRWWQDSASKEIATLAPGFNGTAAFMLPRKGDKYPSPAILMFAARGEDEGGLNGKDIERQQQPLRESQREREREMEMERRRDRGTRGSFGDGDRGERGAHANDGFSCRSSERERDRSRERERIRDSRNRGGRHEGPHGGGGGYRGPSPSRTGGRGGDGDGKDRERGSLERDYRPPDAEELSEADKHDIDLTDLTDSEIAFQIKACYKRTSIPRKCEIKWDNVRFLWKAKTCGRGKEFTPYTKRDMWVKYKGAVEWCEQKLVHWQAREYKGEGGDRERRSGGSFNQPPGALSDAISQTPSTPAAVLIHPPACAALPPRPSRSKEETLETAAEDQVLTFLPRQRETVETAPEEQVLTFLPRQRETVETAPEEQVLTFLPRQKEPEIRPPKRSAAYYLAGANGADVPPPHCAKRPGCIRRMPQWRGDRDVDTSGYPHEYKHHHPPPEARIPMLPPPKILMPPQRRQADENFQWSSTYLASPASLGYSKSQDSRALLTTPLEDPTPMTPSGLSYTVRLTLKGGVKGNSFISGLLAGLAALQISTKGQPRTSGNVVCVDFHSKETAQAARNAAERMPNVLKAAVLLL
uniref:Amine oxidase domain-containing protein n=1 Tax=Chromera velia CCMP2878 TaxID=1169474 RepID=A0A0G4HSZ1_9ALVE|eukprot:Cvel_1333.t1-p1 / transcript=Cvel_1333.t1 / gene=Cvel_1333 / organism=Chromera_velia_CCMP2878 / gene_product=Probable polyamine oxidase 2, putative / transcript_product=Probable polyamine oxidase 2, putative / location=Cvel_scaffold45:124177-135859(-) / protein_length=1077 / sequence_SO=supercontig / SO=protein_coding / is_pseudo=false